LSLSDNGVIALAQDSAQLAGTIVQNRYRIISCIGKGGTGEVFKVEHTLVGRCYALKVLHKALAKSQSVIARFHREARAAAAIGNAHIVEVIDMGYLDNGLPFLVMELLEGRDLYAELSEEGPMSIGRAVGLTTQCCQALESAHNKGIVHRDMKPENIFLTERDDGSDFVKILDFGVSKVLEAAGELTTGKLTWNGAPMGTPQYMSIEQLNSCSDIDFRTDVYATGVVLFEMLTGHVPFEASAFSDLVTKIANEAPPSLDKWRPDIPSELEKVIHRSLAKDRKERFASMAAMANALEPFLENTSRVIVPAEIGRESTLPGVGSRPPDPTGQDSQEDSAVTAETSDRDEQISNGRTTLPGMGSQPADPIDQNSQGDSVIPAEIPSSSFSRRKRPTTQGLIGAVAVGVTAVAAIVYGINSGETTRTRTSTPTGSASTAPTITATDDSRLLRAHSSTESSASTRNSTLSADTKGTSTELKPEVAHQHPTRVSRNAARGNRIFTKRSNKEHPEKPRQYKRNSDRKRTVKSPPSAVVLPDFKQRRPAKKEKRRVKLKNAVRATVNVTLKCKSVSTTIEVSPRGRVSIPIPLERCEVRCKGAGGPVCPSYLSTDAVLLEIR